MLSFFKIIENKKVFVELQLLQSMNIYNIFHSNLLQKISTNSLTNQVNKFLSFIIINNKKEKKVKNILNTKSF